MSEYVDFHYMPLEGKITGKQVLKQTEDAINDLGNKVYNLDIDQSEIDEAVEKSNEAINTANSALSAVTTGRSVWFNNVAEMVATDIEAGVTAETKGYYVANDGGNALYLVRQEKSGDVVDGGSLIALDNGNMAELVTDGTVNVKQFGAIGNGTDDDTTVFQNTSSYAQSKGFVPFVGVATYKITSNVTGTFNSFGELTITGGGTVDIINLQEVVSDVSDIRDEVVDETASAKAYSESAATSATNASNSASSASTTATQLMAYLADKETLTAPAVDPTLSISGAAADAKVTGTNFTNLKTYTGYVDDLLFLPTAFEEATYETTTYTFAYKNGALHIGYRNSSGNSFKPQNNITYASITPASVCVDATQYRNLKIKGSYTLSGDNFGTKLYIFYYKSDVTSSKSATIPLNVGGGTIDFDVFAKALDNNIDINTYPNIVIYGVGSDSTLTATINYDLDVKLDGFYVASGQEKLIDRVEELERKYGLLDTWSHTAKLIAPSIPQYYFAQTENPDSFNNILPYLEDKINSVPKGKSFIFVTDVHWQGNQKHCTDIIAYLKDRLGIKYVIDGGDVLDLSASGFLAKQDLNAYIQKNLEAFGNNFLFCIGNHDANLANTESMTQQQREALVLPYEQIAQVVGNAKKHNLNTYKPYEKLELLISDTDDLKNFKAYFDNVYYTDDTYNKVRYIVYDTGNPAVDENLPYKYFGVANMSEPLLILDWLYDVLLSTPSGYDVVAVGHEIAYGYDNPFSNINKQVPAMLMAAKAKANAKPWIPSNFTDLASWTTLGNRTYNFATMNDIGRVIAISGHWHRDYIVTVSPSVNGYDSNITGVSADVYNTTISQSTPNNVQLPIIVTQTDCQGAQHYSEGCKPMDIGTVTEQCFDIVTIADDGNVYLTRIGSGTDRKITFV